MHAFEAITPSEKLLPGAQITHRGKIPIAPAAPPVPRFPRFRALALFGRRPKERVDSLVMPASENLHMSGSSTFTCRLVGQAGWDVIRAARPSAIPPRISSGLQHVGKGQARV